MNRFRSPDRPIDRHEVEADRDQVFTLLAGERDARPLETKCAGCQKWIEGADILPGEPFPLPDPLRVSHGYCWACLARLMGRDIARLTWKKIKGNTDYLEALR